MYYVYDGSFDGFLCCVYAHFYKEKAEGIRSQEEDQVLLFQEERVETDYNTSHRVYSGIRRKLGEEISERVFFLLLAGVSGKEMIALRYLAACLRYGKAMDSYRTHPDIYEAHRLSEKVRRESYRFIEWMRISEIHGVLYAAFEPEADVTCLMMPHFMDRLPEERLIIHDLRRKKAAVYVNGYWEERPFDKDLREYKASEEGMMENAWQAYFDHIAIKERENKKLQQKFMPLKIRRNLTERFS